MPNVNLQQHSNSNNEPPRQYPYHLLMITNYRLPPGMSYITIASYYRLLLLDRNLML